MKIRMMDRAVAAVVGLLLIAACAALAAQLFFQVDIIGMATRLLQTENPLYRVLLVAGMVLLLALGVYSVMLLFRHRRRGEQFVLQPTEHGELAISLKALENMVNKCLDLHQELKAESVDLENQRDGLLIRINGNVASGISIPLTVDAIQKQISQYVTACSGVEIKSIRVEIESSGPEVSEAMFRIEEPAAKPLLRSGEGAFKPEEQAAETASGSAAEPHLKEDEPAEERVGEVRSAVPAEPVRPAEPVGSEPAAAVPVPEMPEEDEEDDRPMHQRLFSPRPEPCIVPVPPEMTEKAEEESRAEEESQAEGKAETAEETVAEETRANETASDAEGSGDAGEDLPADV